MNYIQRITAALDKDAETVSLLAHLPVLRLENKLQLLKKQMLSAKKYEQYAALELLKIWEDQVLNALELKRNLNIEDSDLVDVDMELTELAGFDMIEKRQQLLKKKLLKEDYLTFLENKN